MAVLVFRHVAFEPVGRIAESLDTHGMEWRYVDLWAGPPAEELSVETAQGLIVMGGPMSVNDSLSWLRQEERLLTAAISSGVPVMGICLGAQLLAKCLGSKVYAMGHKEIGWYPIRLTEAGRTDPLLEGLRAEETVFQWHGDTFELPDGAVHLAGSELCANQAFRHGEHLYGFQFHPEVTPEIIESWGVEDANCGDLREVEVPFDPQANEQRMGEVAAQIFGRWCDLVAMR